MNNKFLRDAKKSICLFLLVFIAYALIYMTKNCYSAAMASIVDEGVMSKSETGLIAAMFYLIYAPFQIVGGIAVDRYPADKLVLIGILGAGISNFLIYFIDSYVGMIIIWSFNAIIQFGVWPGIFKIVSTQLKPEHRTSGIFYISMASTVGLVLSYLCAALIKYWKFNFLFSAVVLFILTAVFFIMYTFIDKSMVRESSVTEVDEAPRDGESVKSKSHSPWGLMLAAGIPFLLVVDVIHSMVNLGIKALAPVMLMESYEAVSPALANVLNIILILAGPVGLFISHTPVFRRLASPVAMSVLLGIMLPLLGVVAFIGKIHIAFVIVALTLIMICAGAMSIFFSYISRTFAQFGCVGTLTGTFNCMASLGIVLANYVFARVAESYGWQFTVICWVAVVALALLLALVSIPVWSKFKNKMSI